jgi:transposase
VVLEASTSARWIAALAESQGHEVIIANPRDIPIVKASVRKCDRHDARLLAELGQVKPGLLSPVHLRSDRYQAVQTLLFARAQLVSQRTSLINFVRAEVRLLGFSLPDCSSKSFASKLGPSISDSLKQAINPLLEILAGIQTPAGSGDGSSIPAPSPG